MYRHKDTKISAFSLKETLFDPQEQNGATITYPLYLRFLDMKRLGNWEIYNRQIWGIIYGDVVKRVRYGYRDWLKDRVNEWFEEL